ncbi:MAG: 5-fold beta-flower protein, partial [Bacteroidota bacterium]
MKRILLFTVLLFIGVTTHAQRLMNSSRSTVGYIESGRVMNSSRSTIGYIEDGRIMNSSRSTIGYI